MSKVYIPETPHVLELFASESARATARKEHMGKFNVWDLWAVARCKRSARPDLFFDGVGLDASVPRWVTAVEAHDYLIESKVPFKHAYLPAHDVKVVGGMYVPVTQDGLFLVNDLFNCPIRAFPAFAQAANPDLTGLQPTFPDEDIARMISVTAGYNQKMMLEALKDSTDPENATAYNHILGQVRSQAIQRLIEDYNGPGLALSSVMRHFARPYNKGRNPLYLGEYEKAIQYL